MKKFDLKSCNKKTFLLSVALVAVIVGIGATVALSMAKSNLVTNTFAAGKIDTEIEEKNDPATMTKRVTVKNSEDAKSDAFVRVRLTVSPELDEIHLFSTKSDKMLEIKSREDQESALTETNSWEYSDNDGFWYYLLPVAPGDSTEQLLDHVRVDEGFKESFDITVYQESCVADPDAKTVEEIQKVFDKAAGIQSESR